MRQSGSQAMPNPARKIDMSAPMFLTLNEVVERYRGQISEGTLYPTGSSVTGADA
jgi:hypothetical protein